MGFDLGQLAQNAVQTVEIRTALTPTITLQVAQLLDGSSSSAPNPIMKLLRPTVVVTGALNETIAPFGEADGSGGWVLLAVAGGAVVLLVGVGVALGLAMR